MAVPHQQKPLRHSHQQARFPVGKPKRPVGLCEMGAVMRRKYMPASDRKNASVLSKRLSRSEKVRLVPATHSSERERVRSWHILPPHDRPHFTQIYTSALFSSYIFSIRSCTSLARVFFCSRSMLATSIGLPNSRTV